MRTLGALPQTLALAGEFRISRDARRSVEVVVVEIRDGDHRGHGEARPYGRYGETTASVLDQISQVAPGIKAGIGPDELLALMPAGAARNAVDCALWDLRAKMTGRSVAALLGLAEVEAADTCQTISLDHPAAMAREAARLAGYPVLKLKLGRDDALACLRAVHEAAPDASLLIDANEGWDIDCLKALLPELGRLGVVLIEQPLPAGDDRALSGLSSPIPICADEACHVADDLAQLQGRYQVVNVKLDKAGGLSAALALVRAARARGFGVMLGSMVASSLGAAPALLLAPLADHVDLDGPTFLARDRDRGLRFAAGRVTMPDRQLWGYPEGS